MSTSQLLCNKYYIYMTSEEGLIHWDIYDPEPTNCGFTAYFSKVFQSVEKNLNNKGLIFYITMTELHKLPSYGDNVIVILLGDEICRIPKYIDKVGAIFKCYGTNQTIGCNPLINFSYLNFLTVITFLRNLIVRIPLILHYQFQKIKSWLLGSIKIAPIFDIPLGYYNSENLPIKNLEARLYDVFFAGSAIHEPYPIWSLQYWLRTPKTISREQMILRVNYFQEKNPEFQVESSITPAFGRANSNETTNSYSERMMNTKICLTPRGTSFETYRFFEAIKYGCIVVAEALPSRWFYDGAPIIKITDWQDLDNILEKLLSEKQLMQELHQKSLNWWETKCSEAVVGEYIAEKLNLLIKPSCESHKD